MKMLPKFKFFILPIIILFFVGVGFLLLDAPGWVNATCQPTPPSPPPSPQILEPSQCDQVSGTQVRIRVSDPLAQSIDLFLHADGHFFPCYTIATNVPPKAPGIFEKIWDSTKVVDYDNYRLVVKATHSSTQEYWNMVAIGATNGKTGTLCEPPDEPQNGNGDGSGDGSDQAPPPSSGNDSQSSQTTTNQTSSSQQTSSTDTSDGSKKGEGGKVEKALIEEEIPISISTFDPDIFLKGSNITIDQIKNVSKKGQQLLHFEGKTLPNTLVTLYVFSNPIIVVVESDGNGRWAYDRERNLDSGKHTAFATIYDDEITRRSKTVDFFIARSAQGSLILQKGNLARLYPYAIALGGALAIAILILFMYRIYSKRKQNQASL